jgi:hypothetical protein
VHGRARQIGDRAKRPVSPYSGRQSRHAEEMLSLWQAETAECPLQAGWWPPGRQRCVRSATRPRSEPCGLESRRSRSAGVDSRVVAPGRVERRLGLRGCSKHDVRIGRTTHVRAHRAASAGRRSCWVPGDPAYPEVYIRLRRYIARSFEVLGGGQSNIHDSGQGGYCDC